MKLIDDLLSGRESILGIQVETDDNDVIAIMYDDYDENQLPKPKKYVECASFDICEQPTEVDKDKQCVDVPILKKNIANTIYGAIEQRECIFTQTTIKKEELARATFQEEEEKDEARVEENQS